jgi:ribonuclease P protein component
LKKTNIYKLRRYSKIKKERSIFSLYKTGTEWKCHHLKIFYYPNKLKSSRLGIIISKDSGTSSLRNMLKRAVREIFRTRISKLEPHCDVLIIICSKNDIFKKKQIEEAVFKWCDYIKKQFVGTLKSAAM